MDIMLQEVVDDIKYFYELYISVAFRFAVFTFLLSAVAGGLYIYWRRRWKNLVCLVFIKSATLALLSAYAYIVVGITMLSRNEDYSDVVNLELFSTFHDDYVSRKYIYENLMLLVPYAIILYILAGVFRRALVSLVMAILTSLLIEYAQMVTHLGRFEVDDILTNVTGYMAAYLMCCVVHDTCLLVRDIFAILKKIIITIKNIMIK